MGDEGASAVRFEDAKWSRGSGRCERPNRERAGAPSARAIRPRGTREGCPRAQRTRRGGKRTRVRLTTTLSRTRARKGLFVISGSGSGETSSTIGSVFGTTASFVCESKGRARGRQGKHVECAQGWRGGGTVRRGARAPTGTRPLVPFAERLGPHAVRASARSARGTRRRRGSSALEPHKKPRVPCFSRGGARTSPRDAPERGDSSSPSRGRFGSRAT